MPQRPRPPRREEAYDEELDDFVEDEQPPWHPPLDEFYDETEYVEEIPQPYGRRRHIPQQPNPQLGRRDIKVKIESFNGELNPEKYLEWEESTSYILDHLGYEEWEKVEVVTIHFTGTARS